MNAGQYHGPMPKEEAHPPVGELIRRQRELAALPLRQLAAMVGISNPYLSQIERGQRAPSPDVLSGIADSLHVSVNYLLHPPAAADESTEPQASQSASVDVLSTDPALTVAQRRAIVEIYEAMADVTAIRRKRRGHSRADQH